MSRRLRSVMLKRALVAALATALSAGVGGCDESEAPTSGTDADGDAHADIGLGDAGSELPLPGPRLDGPLHGVVTTLVFGLEDPAGVAPGFDLDGAVSAGSGDPGCGVVDFESPEGALGVDNQLASLMVLLAETPAFVVEGLIQSQIDDGQLLLIASAHGVDDLMNDDDVTVSLQNGLGAPYLGTDGRILPGQTFDLDPDSPAAVLPGGRIEDGVITAGPGDVTLPIVIFDIHVDLELDDAMVRMRIDERGDVPEFMIGGGLRVDLVEELIDHAGGGLGGLMRPLLEERADLAPDASGECQQLSVGVTGTGASAFVFEE